MPIKIIKKVITGYRFTALMVMNILVVFLLLNGLMSLVFLFIDHDDTNPVSNRYGHSAVKEVYPGWSDEQINVLLEETWSRPYIYEPFTQYKERAFQGTYVNVNENGFRESKNQGSWPPDEDALNIFLFGGSTMFGYGVLDDQTIGSHLQFLLEQKLNRKVRVYNFGRGDYYSTQERILYESFLTAGVIPDVALFLDGLNDFPNLANVPIFTNRFDHFFAENEPGGADLSFIFNSSLGRAAMELKSMMSELKRELDGHAQSDHDIPFEPDLDGEHKLNPQDIVIQRYLKNKKIIEAISKSFGVTPIFVWQPIPNYHYEQKYHPFAPDGYDEFDSAKYGYERFAELLQEEPQADNFLWCADLQKI